MKHSSSLYINIHAKVCQLSFIYLVVAREVGFYLNSWPMPSLLAPASVGDGPRIGRENELAMRTDIMNSATEMLEKGGLKNI